jgi:hypothetical protein
MGWFDRWHDPDDEARAGGGPRLLLTTFGRTCWYFPATEALRPVHAGCGKYYGVCATGAGKSGLRELWIVSRPDQESDDLLLRVDQWRGRVLDTRRLVSRDTHQAVRSGDRLYVTDTHRGAVHEYALPEVRHLRAFDDFTHENHVNSVLVEGPHLMVLCHNKAASTLVRLDRASGVRLHAYENVGEHAHDIVRWRDRYLVCDSRGGLLISVGVDDGHVRSLCGEPGHFAKGLAVEDDVAYFALSLAAVREKRHEVECDLIAYDLAHDRELWRRRLPTHGLVNMIATARGLSSDAEGAP